MRMGIRVAAKQRAPRRTAARACGARSRCGHAVLIFVLAQQLAEVGLVGDERRRWPALRRRCARAHERARLSASGRTRRWVRLCLWRLPLQCHLLLLLLRRRPPPRAERIGSLEHSSRRGMPCRRFDHGPRGRQPACLRRPPLATLRALFRRRVRRRRRRRRAAARARLVHARVAHCERSGPRKGGRYTPPSLPPPTPRTPPPPPQLPTPPRAGARGVWPPALTTSPPGHTPTAPSPSTQCGHAHRGAAQMLFFFFARARPPSFDSPSKRTRRGHAPAPRPPRGRPAPAPERNGNAASVGSGCDGRGGCFERNDPRYGKFRVNPVCTVHTYVHSD